MSKVFAASKAFKAKSTGRYPLSALPNSILGLDKFKDFM